MDSPGRKPWVNDFKTHKVQKGRQNSLRNYESAYLDIIILLEIINGSPPIDSPVRRTI